MPAPEALGTPPGGQARDGFPTPAKNKEVSALDGRHKAVSSPHICLATLLSALKPYRDVFIEGKEGTAPKYALARERLFSVALVLGRGVRS